MKRFIILLRCEQCKREIERPLVVDDDVADADSDMECCGVWMTHVNKKVESLAPANKY